MKNMKRLISLLMCAVLLLGVMGVAALAVNEEPAEEETMQTDSAAAEISDAAEGESDAETEDAAAQEADGSKESKLKSVFRSNLTVQPNDEAGLDSEIKVDLDLAGGTGTLYVPGTVDVSKLTYSWDSENVVLVRGKTEYKSGEAPVAAAGKKITYKIKNGLAFAYLTVKTMQGSAEVQPMYLNIDETRGTIKAMNSDDDHETKCYGKLQVNGFEEYMSIKGRGNSTWEMPKKPYNITLYKDETEDSKKKKVDLLNTGNASKKWTLLANYFDNALIRNKIAYDLAKDMGIGLDTQFVDLWMNGEYLGNYILCQKKDYQTYDNGFVLENDHIPDDNEEQFSFPYMHNMPLKHNVINIDDIGEDAADLGYDLETIEAWFTERWATVLDYDSEDYQKYFDLDSWAKMFLMFEVSKTYDCYAGNIIMYVKNVNKDDVIKAGPAWDYDIAFGRTLHKFLVGVSEPIQVNAEGWYNDSIGYLVSGEKPVTMLQELGKHASFMQHVAKIYSQYKTDFEDLADDVDTQAAVVADSAAMDRDLMGLINLSAEYVVAPTTMSLLGTGKYKLNYKITTGWDDYIYNLKEYCTKRVMWLTDHLYVETPEGSIEVSTGESGNPVLTAVLEQGADNASYQWQILSDEGTWIDLEGADSEEYPVRDAGEHTYRCVVKNTGPVIETYHGGAVENAPQTTLEKVTVTMEGQSADPNGETLEPEPEDDDSSALVIEETDSETTSQKTGILTKLVTKIKEIFSK